MILGDLYIQKRIREGDIREFERLFTRYYQPLCHHVNKVVHDLEASEDIVQEFFYQFWKNRAELNLKFSLNAYLYQSVYNSALHYLSKQEVRRRFAEQSQRDEAANVAKKDPAELSELNRLIENTLMHLPERCSQVFRLNRFEGRKYSEIAVMLSISVKTVEADMGKALQVFRKTLSDYSG
jgi:RNA polymerase sigma-70 factor, ECF subfamily